MGDVTYRVDASELLATVEQLRENGRDLSAEMALNARDLADGLRQNIDRLTSPALSPRYAAWKAKHGSGRGLLRLSNTLYNSCEPGPPEPLRAEAGPGDVPYAAAQNFGFPGTNLPAREFVSIPEDVADRVSTRTMDGVMKRSK